MSYKPPENVDRITPLEKWPNIRMKENNNSELCKIKVYDFQSIKFTLTPKDIVLKQNNNKNKKKKKQEKMLMI